MKRSRPDFPYYMGNPIALDMSCWMLLMLSVLIGFLLLELLPATSFQARFITRLLFAAIPLGTLVWVAGPHANALFGRMTKRDAAAAVLAALLSLLASTACALVVRTFAPVTPNEIAVEMTQMSARGLILNLLSTAPQLLGEELLTILPFLALLRLATVRFNLERGAAIAVALTVSTLVFCAAHLPTYDWNWAQCFAVIGASRLVLTLAYIATRKLWVSTVAHILTDWSEFVLGFMAAPRG